MLARQPEARDLDEDGVDTVGNHLVEERTLLALPHISERCKAETLTTRFDARALVAREDRA